MAIQYLDPTSPQYEELWNKLGVYVFQFQQGEDEYYTHVVQSKVGMDMSLLQNKLNNRGTDPGLTVAV